MHIMYLTAVAFTVSILSSDASAAKDLRGRAGFHPPKQNSSTKLLRYTDAVDIVDEERAPILEHFKTLFKSSKVTPERLQHWLDTGLPAETVFRNMKLDRENAFSLFHDPKFAKWVQYADDLSAKSSHKQDSAISTLATKFDDEALYEMIQAAKDYPNLRELALRL
ncbi:secreted RxLR effector peptide protein, putative [Phytophthora infestans T30-4]|uniref:Secreted RxLR effector peptide protein, putative n=1 Tax=Phytophthora infestans (strain T30-4) TaxID=403677 RepID=D0NVF5_PHYIT|nr:secreted RxLR effector peptide protein, putative [Phytophthora infestans T30-4]EEY66632.1 secreted RxLR effector peptide protein, putative [Phytophthora infestans T30-4]|eukprot:XP_002896933.1 secreted RxLR effector peptide protein, putative [Phytophthora infestans T30-4]